jgi:hypothetical protein
MVKGVYRQRDDGGRKILMYSGPRVGRLPCMHSHVRATFMHQTVGQISTLHPVILNESNGLKCSVT